MSDGVSELSVAQETHSLPPPRVESRDVGPRTLITGLVAVLVTVALMAVLAAVLYPGTTRKRLVDTAIPAPAAPALQSSPRADMTELRRAQRAELDGYGWIDRDRGIAHIPIAQAMRRVASRGIPGWPQ